MARRKRAEELRQRAYDLLADEQEAKAQVFATLAMAAAVEELTGNVFTRTAFFLGSMFRATTDAITAPYRLITEVQRSKAAADDGPARPTRPASRAYRALAAKTRSARARRPIDEAVLEPSEPRELTDAARAAQQQGLPALADALSDPDPEVRIVALETIGAFEEKQAGQMLSDVLHDPDPRVRAEAAAVAGRAKLTPVVFSLILALDDPEEPVREAAREALERITSEPVALQPEDPPEVRRALIEDLKRRWKQRRIAELAGIVDDRGGKGR
jgi:hypothetical protein